MLHWVKRQIRNYFGFTKTETNGVLWLILLIVTFLSVPQIMQWYYSKKQIVNNELDIALLDSLVKELEEQVGASKQAADKRNNALEVVASATKQRAKVNQPHTILAFDINTADTSQLQQIKGIGSILARRIINYRTKLGGFISKLQYQEIYGLDSLIVDRLTEHTYIAINFQPQQLNIHTADFKTLVSHPYLTYGQVKKIIYYREKCGGLISLKDLVELKLLDKATFEKIKPYLRK